MIFQQSMYFKKQFIIIGAAALLLGAVDLGAQEKEKPSPTPLPIASDTTRADSLATAERTDTDKPEMELPEVLILGESRSVRLRESKEQRVPDNPQLVKPDAPSETIDTWFQLQDEKPELQQAATGVNRLTWGGLRGGSFTTLNGVFGHWQELEKGTLSGRAWMDRSAGAFENSQYTQGGVAANGTVNFSKYLRSSLAGEFGLYGRGLHGASFPDTRRDVRLGDINGTLQYMLSQSVTGQFGVEYGGITMESDTGDTGLSTTDNRWITGTGEFNAQFDPVQVSVNAKILNETLEADTLAQLATTFGSYGLEALFPVSHAISAIIGAKYETVTHDTMDNLSRVSPYGRFNITPSNRVGLTISAFTGYEYQAFLQNWEINPYIAHSAPLYPEEVTWGAIFEATVELFPGLNLLGSIGQTSYENAFYWQHDSTTGFFGIGEVNDVEVVNFDVGAHFNPTSWLTMKASFETYLASFSREDTLLSDRNYFPFRPRARIPAELNFTLPWDLQFNIEGELIGKRRISFASSENLPVIGLLNAGLTKEFGDHITVTLDAVNILDDTYEYWLNYPEPGTQIYLGLRAKF